MISGFEADLAQLVRPLSTLERAAAARTLEVIPLFDVPRVDAPDVAPTVGQWSTAYWASQLGRRNWRRRGVPAIQDATQGHRPIGLRPIKNVVCFRSVVGGALRACRRMRLERA